MGCAKKRYQATQSVWSDGTTTAIYHSFFRLMISEWAKARISVMMEGSSGALTISSAVLYGDEEVDFASATASDFGGPVTLTADGPAWGASYAVFDVSRQQVDVGLKVKNSAGSSKMEQARATVLIDVSEA